MPMGRCAICRGAMADGSALSGLFDGEQRLRLGLVLSDEGKPQLELYDRNGVPQASLWLEDNNRPRFVLLSPQGEFLFRAP